MGALRVGIVGLGRLGKRHAENLKNKISGADLTAACSVVEDELLWAEKELGISKTYKNYDTMIVEEALDAVCLISTSAVHAEQSIKALKAGLHVFSEKPMGVSVEECREVEKVVRQHPQQVFFIGFVRRFDPSYAYAKEKIAAGAVGEPFLIRSQTVDLDEYAPFQVKFVPQSGGIFLDCNIHDIDLARWFLGSEIASVHAVGGSYAHPEFEAIHDADNTVALCRFEDNKMAVLSASRTAFHGHDTHTEITGTKGILKIGHTPQKNHVEILDSYGVRKECVNDFYERFQEGFVREIQEFVNCIRENRKPEVSALDGLKATEVGFALTESFKSKKIVSLN